MTPYHLLPPAKLSSHTLYPEHLSQSTYPFYVPKKEEKKKFEYSCISMRCGFTYFMKVYKFLHIKIAHFP